MRVKIAPEVGARSKHTPADQEYLYGLSTRLLMEFQKSTRTSQAAHTKENQSKKVQFLTSFISVIASEFFGFTVMQDRYSRITLGTK
jgi:hypothetical protein